tara:strand:- start:914 stop:1177 length:264 start_codon:yes stop_codon:yes gene_type:complete
MFKGVNRLYNLKLKREREYILKFLMERELNNQTDLYWSLFNKKDDCSHYKNIIHEKDLEIAKLKRELGTFDMNRYSGKISFVSPDIE